MLTKIFGTIFSKTFASIANFLIVILTAKILGAGARGEIAIFVLSVSIVGIFQAIIGGSALTYFAPKESVKKLLIISISWIIPIGFLASLILSLFDLLKIDTLFFVIGVSILQGFMLILQNILVGRKQIRHFNVLEFLRAASLLLFVLLILLDSDLITNDNFSEIEMIYLAYGMANTITITLGVFYLKRLPKLNSAYKTIDLSKQIFLFGIKVQVTNISQIFNYRFVYFVIEKFKGVEVLGVFSVAISIAETIWIISKSISTYQTSVLLNTKDLLEQKLKTINFSKMSLAFTSLATFLLLLIPAKFYLFIFGPEFKEIKTIILFFTPAILFLSFFGILNRYFYCINRNGLNIYSSIFGNILTILFALFLIKYFGVNGAAVTYSLVNFGMMFFVLIQFRKISQMRFSSFLPNRYDLLNFQKLIQKK